MYRQYIEYIARWSEHEKKPKKPRQFIVAMAALAMWKSYL